jgi:hypothetical protein
MNLFSRTNKQTVQLSEKVRKDILHPTTGNINSELSEIDRYLKAGVRLDKILDSIGQANTWYKEQFITTQPHVLMGYDEVNAINNSNGIIISSERYGVDNWRYAFVPDIKDKTPEPKEDVSINLNIYIKPKVSAEQITVDINIGNPELKNVVIMYPKDGKSDVYLCDSGWKFTSRYDVCTTNFSDYLHSKFPDYDYSHFENNELGVKCVLKRVMTLRRTPKNDYAWNIGDFRLVKYSDNCWFIRSTNPDGDVTALSGTSIDSVVEQLEKAMERKGFVVDERKTYKGQIYYTVKKKEPDWRVGSYYFKHTGTIVNPFTLGYEKCYELWSFSSGCNCSGRIWERQFNNFTSNFCNGGKYETKCIEGILYYKPKK